MRRHKLDSTELATKK